MKPFLHAVVAALTLAASSGLARAEAFTFTAADTPVSGSEATPLVSTISVAGSGDIEDLNVLVDYTTSFAGDVTLTLTHVNTGTSVVLFNGHGGADDNITSVTFDDEAATNISGGTAPFGPGSFIPFNPLTVFDGESIFGTWTLTATDAVDDNTGHSINTFQLNGSIVTPEPGTWALFGLGAAGLAAAVRRRRKLTKQA